MNFGFTEEQSLLRDQVRRYLDQQCAIPEVRKIIADEQGFSRQQWSQFAELGWLALLVPEQHGGLGLSWVDMLVILEEMGRTITPGPFISHTLAARLISQVATAEQQANYLPDIATGSRIATTALLDEPDFVHPESVSLAATATADGLLLNGSKSFVNDAGIADIFVVACRVDSAQALVVVDKTQTGVSVSNVATVDETKRMGCLSLNNVRVPSAQILLRGDAVWPAIQRNLDEGAVAVCAEMVGTGEAILKLTSQYANDRVQFGNPIGKYQGIKHRLAEIYVDIESIKSLVYYAAWTLDHSPEERQRSVSLAKAYGSEAFPEMGIEGVQLHGAIGFTAEYDVQLFLKRSKWSRPMFGDADYHFERVAALGGV